MLLDILLIVLLIAVLGGFGHRAGWAFPATWDLLNVVLVVLLILIVLSLISPYPFRHYWW